MKREGHGLEESEQAIGTMGDSRPAWKLIAGLAVRLGQDFGWRKLADVRRAMAPEASQPLGRRRAQRGSFVVSAVEYLFMFGKAFFVVMFAMNVAVILTWADRRYGALLQDRVGPDRAVIWSHERGCLLRRGSCLALRLLGLPWATPRGHQGEDLPSSSADPMLFAQAAIFMTWFTGLIIAGAVKRRGSRGSFDTFIKSLGDPRNSFTRA